MSELSFYDLTYEGPVVQAILDTAQKLRTDGYVFLGAGTPSTVPGTPTERVWYLCGPGTYANFGTSVAVPDGSVMVASYANSTWTKTVIAINGGAAVSGWKVVDSVASLPSSPEDPSLGWIIDNTVYLYVGEGGDTLSGKYQSMGDFQGPQGADGAPGPQGPAGLDGISIGDNWTAFSDLGQLNGKTDAQLSAMLPTAKVLDFEELTVFKSIQKRNISSTGIAVITTATAWVKFYYLGGYDMVRIHAYQPSTSANKAAVFVNYNFVDDTWTYSTFIELSGYSQYGEMTLSVPSDANAIVLFENTASGIVGNPATCHGYNGKKRDAYRRRLDLLVGSTAPSALVWSTYPRSDKSGWGTPRYLRLANRRVRFESKTDFYVDFRYYDENYTYFNVGASVKHATYNSTTQMYVFEEICKSNLIRANFGANQAFTASFTPEIYAEGVVEEVFSLPKDFEIALTIPVNVTNPNSCDAQTSTVQDSETLLTDYGLINLPPTYSNVGKPTRMIIFCHGSAIHYTEGQKTFPSTAYGTDPAYWLSEGYAVMDIEGNPFNNTNVHKFAPQAYECYKAAYNYCIQLFNICRDGVFIGGRSLGGGMCFDIATRVGIPVIAACPFCPSIVNEFGLWAYFSAAERGFTATHMGMTGTITWTANNPLSDNEIAYLVANKDKLVRYSPSWRVIDDLPDMDTLKTVAKATNSNYSAEVTLYSALHIKTNVPFKFFGALDDTDALPPRGMELYYRMLCNGGNICELRFFQTGGHPFDLAAANRVATFVNTRGETLTDVPIAYIEALEFWRRYENEGAV